MRDPVELEASDALVLVDVQHDFLPGGALPVPLGNEVVPPLNGYIALFRSRGLPVFATRDWHPPDHCSFVGQGGPWPPHCVAGSAGARFADDLALPEDVTIISKDTGREQNTYSGFEDTDLGARLRRLGVRRLFIGGLATDYCVLNTVRDALRLGFGVFLLDDAVRAVDVDPGDGRRARKTMLELGALPLSLGALRA
ncbi:MAG: isochorismatase family protein [Xanthomonadales bacterium]|nr:isochorismatase family protein [Xanthomonadales bacterium]NIN60410.1 isochorismatase family protein [Xanthomonadales bacterium]NIN75763.1 isochorismatase family protein [Xanthomonadales bacterium]NIO12941.1 isochorismatase family protein [Xanthomonadales bacterium]NIP12803.1 isochorismatase family protein [Xanthomonadales bacterium]